jgi:hypothetical protein
MNKIIATLFLGCLVLGGCTSTTINEFRQALIELSDQDSVVILGRRQSGQHETEPFLIDCIAKELDALGKNVQIIGEIEFINRLYPWFEPRTAPLSPDRLRMMMDNPKIASEINAMNLAYMVWVEGSTVRGDSTGAMSCTISPTFVGCFGFGSWEDDASYEIAIWDVETFNSVAWLSASASGTSYMPAIVAPIPLIARVKTQVCESIADQILLMFTENLAG